VVQPRWWEATWTSLRIALALVILAAIAAQFAVTIGNAAAAEHSLALTSANFFSFFTILSNLGSATVLLWAGCWWIAVGRSSTATDPRPLAVALACLTTYMLVTGVVYNTLLRGIPVPPGTVVPWSNEVLHAIAPTFLLLDLLLAPRRRSLAWGTIGGILVFPLLWIAYTMVRGPLTVNPVTSEAPWYPYPFLYPDRVPGGYLGVAGYIVAIALLIGGCGALVVAVGRWRARRALLVRDGVAGRAH
jgi:hypothetical protein